MNDEQLDVGDQEKLKGVHDVEGSKQRQRALGDDKLAVELVLIQGKGGNVAGCGDVGEAEHAQDVTKKHRGNMRRMLQKNTGGGAGRYMSHSHETAPRMEPHTHMQMKGPYMLRVLQYCSV